MYIIWCTSRSYMRSIGPVVGVQRCDIAPRPEGYITFKDTHYTSYFYQTVLVYYNDHPSHQVYIQYIYPTTSKG